MKTIRTGIWETNSSSTHAICVPKKVNDSNYSFYDSLYHNYGFGREESRLVNSWDEKLAYIYIVLNDYKNWEDGGRMTITKEDIYSFKERVENIYSGLLKDNKCIYYDVSSQPKDIFKEVDEDKRYNCYVEHTEDFNKNGFLTRILNDNDFLKKFLFNTKSYITVGGDEYRGYNIKTIGFEYDYDSGEDYNDSEFWDKLKEYEKENDVYLKGN